MVFAKYGSILKHLVKKQRYTEEEIRTIMAQLLLAVDLIHRKGIIHRDIKPDNILLMDMRELKICISDLGMACLTTNEVETKLKCGTPGYVAPDVLKGA
jgi:serine/threonine protein kinase